jgi:GrpB-like predicted nucleotidyltransferase (UPF0157 family)
MARRMEVVEYSDAWPARYAKEAEALRAALGAQVVRIHHVGSTAVPGLAAKPVIDILLEVRSVSDLDASSEVMRRLDYEPRGEFGIPGRRYYPKGGDCRTHHVHAFAVGDPQVERMLAFRDYLRAHPACAEAYAVVKRAASDAHLEDPEGYVASKHDYVEKTVAQAVQWAQAARDPRRASQKEDAS